MSTPQPFACQYKSRTTPLEYFCKGLVRVGLVSIVLTLLILFVAACSRPHEFTGKLLQDPRPVYDAIGSDQFGRPLHLNDLRGRYVLVNFGYTSCPDICPLTLHELAKFYDLLTEQDEALADRIAVVFITVDPKRDTPERLEPYMNAFNDNFIGLYIEDEETLEITKQSFAVFAQVAEGSDPNAENYFVDHTGGIFVLNPDGEWGLFLSHDVASEEILADMKAFMAE